MATEVQPYLTADQFVQAMRDSDLVPAKRPSLLLEGGHYCLYVTNFGELAIKHNDELVVVMNTAELWLAMAWMYSTFAPWLDQYVAQELANLIARTT